MATAEPCATVRETVRFEGVGLHTGELCRIAIHPVSEVRTPCAITLRKGASVFPARWDFVVDTTRATVLGDGATRISTVEHLMAALWMTGITHCDIEVLQGNEIPILDGSALPFVQALQAVKIVMEKLPPSLRFPPLREGNQPNAVPPAGRGNLKEGVILAFEERSGGNLQHLPVGEGNQPNAVPPAGRGNLKEGVMIEARHADRYLGLAFGGGVLFGYIDFPAPLGVQADAFPLADAAAQIAPARTFGFLREVEALRQQGLALGGALDNALLIDETGYHNPARFEDEPLRHKLLDVLGDLYLCGARLTGFTLVAIKPGHALNVQLAQQAAQAIFAED
jgi:UDP-3-O-[3-hydroxymyristoyl] N-acetylglucosamine deacetylase